MAHMAADQGADCHTQDPERAGERSHQMDGDAGPIATRQTSAYLVAIVSSTFL